MNLDKILSAKIKQLSIDIRQPIIEAIRLMDALMVKLLIVTNNDKYFSLISIGDIQRAIIHKQSFKIEIGKILRNKVRVARHNENIEDIKRVMLEFRTEFMPVLNDNNELVDIIFWKDVFDVSHNESEKKIDLPIIIMAGGKGERLKPITNIIPKALVPLGEKPIVEIIIDSFAKSGCCNFWLSLNYKGEMIIDYFKQIQDKKYTVNFFFETKPLGTIGSLSLIKHKIKSLFFVSNCDIIIDQDYFEILKYHQANKNELTIVSALKYFTIPYGTLQVKNNGILSRLSEKPEMFYNINTGVYILEPHLLNEIPENEFFHITDLIEKIQNRKGRIGVFPISENNWFDIGEWNQYYKSHAEFLKRSKK